MHKCIRFCMEKVHFPALWQHTWLLRWVWPSDPSLLSWDCQLHRWVVLSSQKLQLQGRINVFTLAGQTLNPQGFAEKRLPAKEIPTCPIKQNTPNRNPFFFLFSDRLFSQGEILQKTSCRISHVYVSEQRQPAVHNTLIKFEAFPGNKSVIPKICYSVCRCEYSQ